MQPIDFLSRLVGILAFFGVIIAGYTRLVTKIKELEFKVDNMQRQIDAAGNDAEKKEDRIMNKLDEMSKDINQIKIDLRDKQDRN
jgi:seryl-tRNA synthetase